VTEEQINTFYQDGAILLKNVFSEEWVEKVKTGIEKNLENPSQYSEKLALKEGQVGSNQKQLEKYFKMQVTDQKLIIIDHRVTILMITVTGKLLMSSETLRIILRPQK